MTVSLLKYYPPPRHDRRLEFAVRHRDFVRTATGGLSQKRVVIEALERLDRLIDSMPEDFPFDERAKALLRNDLGEQAIPAMETLLRDPDITEDEIRRVQGMNYGKYPYGPAEHYRFLPAFRHNGLGPQWMPSPLEIPERMRELINWVNSPEARILHPFLRAVMFYARYDQIHPFEGQTKHTARFFMDKILLQGERGRRFPPVLAAKDFNTYLHIRYLKDEQLAEIMNSHRPTREGRTTDLVRLLLCLYVNNLDRAFYGMYADRDSNEEMRGLVCLLNPQTRDFFELSS